MSSILDADTVAAMLNVLPFDSSSIQRNEYGWKCSSSTIMSSQ